MTRTRVLRENLRAAACYFALVFAAGFALGVIRVPFLAPRLGVRIAELVEMPVMLVVVYFAARFVVRRFAVPAAAGPRIAVGLVALALLLTAEALLAVALGGRSLAAAIADRDPVSGAAYLAALLVFAAMPWLQARFAGHR